MAVFLHLWQDIESNTCLAFGLLFGAWAVLAMKWELVTTHLRQQTLSKSEIWLKISRYDLSTGITFGKIVYDDSSWCLETTLHSYIPSAWKHYSFIYNILCSYWIPIHILD
jgi:hypothetical protein